MFGKIKRKQVAQLCRELHTMSRSGVSIARSLEVLERGGRDPRFKWRMGEVRAAVESGQHLGAAFRRAGDGKYFPPLFVDMIEVAENTGTLDVVSRNLADYYEFQIRLIKHLIGKLMFPIIELLLAIFVIAGLIWIMGMLSEEVDILGWGLRGADGALKFLGIVFGGGCVLAILYWAVTNLLRGKRAAHEMLLRLPAIGNCLRTLALSRFTWALHLMLHAAAPIRESIEQSLRSTNNAAFAARSDEMVEAVLGGDTIRNAMERTGIFPPEFLEIVEVGEMSGTLAETMKRVSKEYEEDAERALTTMATIFGWGIWILVAFIIVLFILKVAAFYASVLSKAMQG